MIIWRMGFTCWINKAKHALTISNTYCFSIAIIVPRTRLNIMLCVYYLSYLNITTWLISKHRILPTNIRDRKSNSCGSSEIEPVLFKLLKFSRLTKNGVT